MSTMYKDVCTMNVAFGNERGDPRNPNWAKLEAQCKNILDEYNELFEDGINPKDINGFRDAICDILVFTLGAAHMAGIPVEADMAEVFRSNMSKFCKDENELSATVRKYSDLGVETYVDGEFPMKRVKSTKEQTDKKGNVYRKGKMLKCVAFQEPIFVSLEEVAEADAFDAFKFVPQFETLLG